MHQRKPYVKRIKDGGAVPADDAPALSRIAAEMSAEAAPAANAAPERAVEPQASHREGQFTKWRQQGLSGAQAAFLSKNPHMADHPSLLATAAMAAKEGCQLHDIEPDTEEYFEVLKAKFDDLLKPAPRYFEPEGGFESAPRERSTIVSAPVERHVPSSNYRDRGQIRLTDAQRDAARIAGISESLYEQQLQRLNAAKEEGHYHGGQP